MNGLLIAGTDTNVGKTVLTVALAAYWQTYRPDQSLGLLKPIQTGTGDRELYSQLFQLNPLEVTALQFQAPLAPPVAAAQEGRRIDIETLWQSFSQLQQAREFVLVEGLGGLGSPVDYETTVADLAWDWQIPTVLVVPVRLGAIAQAVANVALSNQSHVCLRGIVLNCVQPCTSEQIEQWAPADLIQSLTQVPVLGYLPYLSNPLDLVQLAQAAAGLDLERLLPMRYAAAS
jgi:dethiobiotin synthetase